MEKFFDFYGALELVSSRLKKSKLSSRQQEQMADKLYSMRHRAKRLQTDIEKAIREITEIVNDQK